MHVYSDPLYLVVGPRRSGRNIGICGVVDEDFMQQGGYGFPRTRLLGDSLKRGNAESPYHLTVPLPAVMVVNCYVTGRRLTSPALGKGGGSAHEAHNEVDRGGASLGGNDVGYYGHTGVCAGTAAVPAGAAAASSGAAGRDGKHNGVRHARGRSRNASRDDRWPLRWPLTS